MTSKAQMWSKDKGLICYWEVLTYLDLLLLSYKLHKFSVTSYRYFTISVFKFKVRYKAIKDIIINGLKCHYTFLTNESYIN